MSSEIWKPVLNYRGLYEVSSEGRVRSLDRLIDRSASNQGGYVLPGRVLKTLFDRDGYENVGLNCGQNPRTHKVHRIVAEAFLPNFEGFPQVDHLDGNPANNKVSNLRWASVSDNLKTRWDVKLGASGQRGVRIQQRKQGLRYQAYHNDPDTGKFKHLGVFGTLDEAVACRAEYLRGLAR